MKARVKLKLEVKILNNWKNMVIGISLTPKILMIILLRVNCDIDSVVASIKETLFINVSSFCGIFGMSFPANIAFQHVTVCLRTLYLKKDLLI